MEVGDPEDLKLLVFLTGNSIMHQYHTEADQFSLKIQLTTLMLMLMLMLMWMSISMMHGFFGRSRHSVGYCQHLRGPVAEPPCNLIDSVRVKDCGIFGRWYWFHFQSDQNQNVPMGVAGIQLLLLEGPVKVDFFGKTQSDEE